MISLDKDLVFLYAENVRTKIKGLSHILKKSSQRLKYSMKQLHKEGLVHNPHCVFDYSYLGLILFRVYFKSGYISEKDKAEILKKLSENPYVVSIYELNGEFDMVIELQSPNPSRFNKELKKVIAIVPTFKNYKIILNVVSRIYPMAYMTKKTQCLEYQPKELIVGGDRTVEDFTKNEMLVLKNLLENPTIRLTALARKAGINIKTFTGVMKNLKSRKVIKGFKYVVNTNKLGVNKMRLFLRMHGATPEKDSQLQEYFLATREIIQINRTVGDWDMEIDIESFDKTRVRFLINEIREKFNDIIETFNCIEFNQYYRKAYLPEFVFSEGKE